MGLGIHGIIAAQRGTRGYAAKVRIGMKRSYRLGGEAGDLALPLLHRPGGRQRSEGMNLDERPLRATTGNRNSNRPVAGRKPSDVDGLAAPDESPAESSATGAWRPSPTEAAEVGPIAAAIRSPAPRITRGPEVADAGILDP